VFDQVSLRRSPFYWIRVAKQFAQGQKVEIDIIEIIIIIIHHHYLS